MLETVNEGVRNPPFTVSLDHLMPDTMKGGCQVHGLLVVVGHWVRVAGRLLAVFPTNIPARLLNIHVRKAC